MVSEARSWEQGARSGRREAPRYLLSVLSLLEDAGDTLPLQAPRYHRSTEFQQGGELNS
jgi:hypothetical protein